MARSRTQSAVEFVEQYSSALLILVLAIITVYFISLPLSQSSNSPSYCYITPEINCYQMLVSSNSVETNVSIVFTNNLGQSIYLPSSTAFYVALTATSPFSSGTCDTSVLKAGDSAECSAILTGYIISPGMQLSPRFYLSYMGCKDASCTEMSSTPTNASGIANAYATPIIASTATTTTTPPLRQARLRLQRRPR